MSQLLQEIENDMKTPIPVLLENKVQSEARSKILDLVLNSNNKKCWFDWLSKRYNQDVYYDQTQVLKELQLAMLFCKE
jgi:hypothetical protein